MAMSSAPPSSPYVIERHAGEISPLKSASRERGALFKGRPPFSLQRFVTIAMSMSGDPELQVPISSVNPFECFEKVSELFFLV